MAGSKNDNRQLLSRLLLGFVVLVLAGGMLLYLVPQGPGSITGEASSDVVAKVGDLNVTVADVSQKLAQIQQRGQIPKQLEGYYSQQILKELIFQKELEYEAKRLNITVSDQERAARIRQFIPTAFNGDTFVGMDRYAQEVQQRTQLTVPVFEDLVRQALVEEKFRKYITDGISVGPAELQQEFVNRNQKVKLDYALIKPEDLEGKINPSDSDISTAYEKNKAAYNIPEKRVVRYALVDINQIRQSVQVSDDALKVEYQRNIQSYGVPNRVHAEHILLMTVSKTDAEVAEIKNKAEDILKQAKKGAKFEDLANKYSEDPGSKTKGGDLGWIVQGQTVPEFEKAAFSLDKGTISDLVKTQYGFHIIKVLDKEPAHTKPFEEVRDTLRGPFALNEADRQASDIADKIATTLRQSDKISIDDLAKQYHLNVSDTRLVSSTDPLLELGNSTEVKEAIFRLKQGELSQPIHMDRGYVVLSLKQDLPAHSGTLEEVRDRVITELKQQKAAEQTRAKAEDLSKRAKSGEKFDAAAKALGLDPKTSDAITRDGSIPSVGSGKSLSAAFVMKVGDVSDAQSLGLNWLVYRLAEKQEPVQADFDKQKKSLADSVLQTKRGIAFEAFRVSLDNRLKSEGKLTVMTDKMKTFGGGQGNPFGPLGANF
jgi:peptidyl-prolyl cis-trans isomerase D